MNIKKLMTLNGVKNLHYADSKYDEPLKTLTNILQYQHYLNNAVLKLAMMLDSDEVAKIYSRLINDGYAILDEVPEKWHAAVCKLLESNQTKSA